MKVVNVAFYMSGWRNGDVLTMLRQCAWCLRLIDFAGERVSMQPLPKLYEASHGMCGVCGTLWMEQVFNSLAPQVSSLYLEMYSSQGTPCVSQDSSFLNCTSGFSFQQLEVDVAPMVVCESNSSYSPHTVYPLLEEQEPALEDNATSQDLKHISRRRQP